MGLDWAGLAHGRVSLSALPCVLALEGHGDAAGLSRQGRGCSAQQQRSEQAAGPGSQKVPVGVGRGTTAPRPAALVPTGGKKEQLNSNALFVREAILNHLLCG